MNRIDSLLFALENCITENCLLTGYNGRKGSCVRVAKESSQRLDVTFLCSVRAPATIIKKDLLVW